MPKPTHVTFVHGIGNQPPPDSVRTAWLNALARESGEDDGLRLGAYGITTSLVYWADLFYGESAAVGAYESAIETFGGEEAGDADLPEDPWIERLRDRYPEMAEGAEIGETDDGFERLPAPIFRGLTVFLRQVHSFLFDPSLRREIRSRLVRDCELVPEGARHVIVAHSLGSVIAYDVLATPGAKSVDGLLTLGSPLGLAEVREELPWNAEDGFPSTVSGDWVNVFDRADPVPLLSRELRSRFRRGGAELVVDVTQQNRGLNKHPAERYFEGRELRQRLRGLCQLEE